MKRCWNERELAEHWTLFEAETALLANRTGRGRMGVAVLLKYFQLNRRFPRQHRDTPGCSPGVLGRASVCRSRDLVRLRPLGPQRAAAPGNRRRARRPSDPDCSPYRGARRAAGRRRAGRGDPQGRGQDRAAVSHRRSGLQNPDRTVREALFPLAGEETLSPLVQESKASGPTFRQRIRTLIHRSYAHHYRRMLPLISRRNP